MSKKSLCLIVLALPLLLCIGCAPSAAPVKDRYLSSPPLEDQVAALKGKLAQSKGADPTLLRELGLALLVSGDSHEAETLLSQARSQGVSDSLTFLGDRKSVV